MKLKKQDLKTFFLKLFIYFIFMLGVIILIDAFNIEYSTITKVVYWGILAIFWFWMSNQFDDSKCYYKIYKESLEIWASDRK